VFESQAGCRGEGPTGTGSTAWVTLAVHTVPRTASPARGTAGRGAPNPTYAPTMSYAGDVTPIDAYAAVTGEGDALLLDCRTHAEWSYVGVPDLSASGRRAAFVQWQSYPEGAVNSGFVAQAREAGARPGRPVYVLCRSGVRSIAAAEALTAAGLGPAYNVLDGFEGPHDAQGHRTLGGWKNDGLPWRQG
jgi:rhodanese-related sulfurtransferase